MHKRSSLMIQFRGEVLDDLQKYSERKSNTSQDSEGELAFEELTEDQLSVHEDSSLNSILEVRFSLYPSMPPCNLMLYLTFW